MVLVIQGKKEKVDKRDLDKEIRLEKLKQKNLKNLQKAKSSKSKSKIRIGYRPSLSSNLVRQFGGGNSQGSQQRVKAGPGRPAGPASYKHRSPFNGQPISATEYYKQIREFRRRQIQQAQISQNQQVQQLSKKGIPPSVAQQVIQQRVQQVSQPQNQLTQEQIRQLQVQRLMEQQNQNTSSAVRPIWRRQSVVRFETDIFGNRRPILQGNDPRSFWN